MMSYNWRKLFRYAIIFTVTIAILYGGGRLYYYVTDGFTLANIVYDYPSDIRQEVALLPGNEKLKVVEALNQPFHYLGKGCQSYVFASEDGKYVVKFFKYQRFRPQEWLSYFSFIPTLEKYRQEKIEKKKKKLESVFKSWKIAYEYLPRETGVLYAHLNKAEEFKSPLVIFDKMGFQNVVNLNETEFLIQKKADMLCPTLTKLMEEKNQKQAEAILADLIRMLVLEYAQGFADNDHALMQNTGVLRASPVHIDVGQFIKNPIVQNPKVYHQEIFNKMYKFRMWLDKRHPSLKSFVDQRLADLIGEQFWIMKPVFYTSDMARIPNA